MQQTFSNEPGILRYSSLTIKLQNDRFLYKRTKEKANSV